MATITLFIASERSRTAPRPPTTTAKVVHGQHLVRWLMTDIVLTKCGSHKHHRMEEKWSSSNSIDQEKWNDYTWIRRLTYLHYEIDGSSITHQRLQAEYNSAVSSDPERQDTTLTISTTMVYRNLFTCLSKLLEHLGNGHAYAFFKPISSKNRVA